MSYRKTVKLTFIILTLIFFLLGLNFGESNNENITRLSYTYIPIIFLVNLLSVFICLLIAPTGLSLVLIFKIIFTIGLSSNSTILPIYMYLPISLIHGIFEIICLYISYKLTISHWFNYLSNNESQRFVIFKSLLKKVFTHYLPIVIVLLIIGAILEVLVSNRIAIYFS